MNNSRFAKRVATGAAFVFLSGMPGLAQMQSNPPSPAQTPQRVRPAVRPKKEARATDDFAGLTFTDEQKAKIDQIHQDMKSRMDIVAKDEKLSADQKEAMITGFRRMERNQVFQVLTPEQQVEVRKKSRARRAAEQEANKKKLQPPPK